MASNQQVMDRVNEIVSRRKVYPAKHTPWTPLEKALLDTLTKAVRTVGTLLNRIKELEDNAQTTNTAKERREDAQ